MVTVAVPSRPRTAVAHPHPLTAAEFFAGIGLVRQALEQAGFNVRFANDIERFKRNLYQANFGEQDFVLDDIRNVRGDDVPHVDLATASFPCTDLSLAGARRGLAGAESGLFWEFTRVLEEMAERRPSHVLVENVPGLLTSHAGEDLRAAVARLNELGYACDLILLDAALFVPQSRLRLFIIGGPYSDSQISPHKPSPLRPDSIRSFADRNPDLDLRFADIEPPPPAEVALDDVVERLDARDELWWDDARVDRFRSSLSDLQETRLYRRVKGREVSWATAYRRTRRGKATWEIRADSRAGCLRTARGGSSKQALVEAGRDRLRVRWMTSREYASLQGAPNYCIPPAVTENQALFGFGDAVCVPAVRWVIEQCIVPSIRAAKAGAPAKRR
ncbi:MAG: DNA (cytosine-5-)-methyltransferase [Chloroflexi bacterium HGW-Chloroflexi-9]|nr:MAG: DNA (cytosine-5-)-methyltransferase [Chloroflexi bacterium HGW-Chloroflexi-9]